MPFPATSILNFKPNANDPICNALTVKTGYNLSKDINIYAFKGTDLIVDVLGYYYNAEPEKITAVSVYGSTASIPIYTSYTTVMSKAVNVPYSGRIVITASSSFTHQEINSMTCRFTENDTQIDIWYFGDPDVMFGHM